MFLRVQLNCNPPPPAPWHKRDQNTSSRMPVCFLSVPLRLKWIIPENPQDSIGCPAMRFFFFGGIPRFWRYRLIFHRRWRRRVSAEGNVWNKTTCAASSSVYQKRKVRKPIGTVRTSQTKHATFFFKLFKEAVNCCTYLRWFSWFFFFTVEVSSKCVKLLSELSLYRTNSSL